MGWGSWTSAREQSDSECEMAEGQLLSFISRDRPATPSCLLIIASNKIVLVRAISFIFHKGKLSRCACKNKSKACNKSSQKILCALLICRSKMDCGDVFVNTVYGDIKENITPSRLSFVASAFTRPFTKTMHCLPDVSQITSVANILNNISIDCIHQNISKVHFKMCF